MNARACLRLVLVMAGIGFIPAGRSAAPYTLQDETHPKEPGTILRERARKITLDAQKTHRLRVSMPKAVGDNVELAPSARPLAPLRPPPEPSFFEGKEDYVRLGLVGVLLAVLTAQTLARQKREAEIKALSRGYLSDAIDLASYKVPQWFAAPPPEFQSQALADMEMNVSSREETVPVPLAQFFENAPDQLAKIRDLLKELAGTVELELRQQVLLKVLEILSELQSKANCWELRPAWQMSSALELLVKRIAAKPKDGTASVMRTVVSAVDLLYELCVPGIRPNLITEPPIRILAVDDDPLCRRALQVSLEKANLTPDLAENGAQAVGLATHHSYDVVFMDIQMPGIDGLTACTQIHKTEKNADVPVIFVTVQSDFNTRAQSRLKGGTDVIAKPYLMFELTVKAVAFTMRKRLQMLESRRREVALSKPVIPALQLFTGIQPELRMAEPRTREQVIETVEHKPIATAPEWKGDFFTGVPARLASARKIIDEMHAAPATANLEEQAGALYLGVHAIATNAASEELPVASSVASTLEALLKRLYKSPRLITESTLNTVTNALTLLDSLCVPGVDAKLAYHPPVRLLVVDDEPLAQRAIVGALQLAFEKPMSANDGTLGAALVAKHAYDVIFTDVEMPGMDGFALCSAIRASALNRDTPVVFITNYTEVEAQSKAGESGGNDFIGKPFLPIEITVKALTFTWQARLKKVNASTASVAAAASPQDSKPLSVAPRNPPAALVAA